MIEKENFYETQFSPFKKVTHSKYKQKQESLQLRKNLEEKDQLINGLQSQLIDANKQIIQYKDEQKELQNKLVRQEEYIKQCMNIITDQLNFQKGYNLLIFILEPLFIEYIQLNVIEKNLSLPTLVKPSYVGEYNFQDVIKQQKTTKKEINNDNTQENKKVIRRVSLERKHFETSNDSISLNDIQSPRNNSQPHRQKLNMNKSECSIQKIIKSQQNQENIQYFLDEQYKQKQLISKQRKIKENRSIQQQFQYNSYNDGKSMDGCQSVTNRQTLTKQSQKQNQLRSSLQEIHFNKVSMSVENKNKLAANLNIPLSQMKAKIFDHQQRKENNIFSKQNQDLNYFKSKQFHGHTSTQMQSTPDQSLIKVPMSKLQKIQSREIKRRINLKVDTQIDQ